MNTFPDPPTYCEDKNHRPRYAVFEIKYFDQHKTKLCKECFRTQSKENRLGNVDKVNVIRKTR